MQAYRRLTDQRLAEMLLDRMEATGLENVSVAAAGTLIREAVVEFWRPALGERVEQQVGRLGTSRAQRILRAWLPVALAERRVERARIEGSDAGEAMNALSLTKRAARDYDTKMRVAEGHRSHIRRHVEAPRAADGFRQGVLNAARLALADAAMAGRNSTQSATEIALDLIGRIEAAIDQPRPPPRPGRKPKPDSESLPAGQYDCLIDTI